MIINSTKLLQLLAKAQRLGIKYAVDEFNPDEYGIHFSIEGASYAHASYAHLQIKESQIRLCSDFDTIDKAMKYLDIMYKEKIKNDKRKVVLDKLTDEEKELLNLK